MPATRPLTDHMAARVKTGGSAPLLTHYRPALGERTELSVTSFANWVDKTANLIDDLGLGFGDDIALPVLLEAPTHWMSLVWPFALWARGLTARVADRADAASADLAVIGPTSPAPVAEVTLACSLHPWARPLAGLPAGVDDFCSEALSQPDAHAVVAASPEAVAWIDVERTAAFGDLAALPGIAGRVAARPADAWASVSLLARAIVGGGSVVIVDGDGDLARIASAEHAAIDPEPGME